MSDLSKLISEISPEQRELLLLRLGQMKVQGEDPSLSHITHKDGHSFFPLSYAQLRLWFVEELDPGSPAYNVYVAFRLQGSLNVGALERSFSRILSRHEILRATFAVVDDQPVQIISSEVEISLPVVDLSELRQVEREAEASRRVVAETRRPFDLARGPLFRVTLLRLGEEEHVLQITVHHIVSDGWSLEILLGELSNWYKIFTVGGDPLKPLPLSYLNYIQLQKQKTEDEILDQQLPYWRKQLKAAMPVMDLPIKGTRPTTQTFTGTNQEFLLSPTLTQRLKSLSQREGITLYMTLLAAFQTLLHRYTGQDDILVGSPVAGRNRIETEALIGMFVNTLVLRTDLSGNPTFRGLLARVREVALGAMAHQELPFEKLVEDLQPERSVSHMPLFNVAFVFQKALKQRLELVGLTVDRLRIEGATAKFDLTLYLTEGSDSVEGVLEYNTDLFAEDTIRRMVGHFQTLLGGIVADPDQRVNDLPLLTTAEEQQLLVVWNETSLDYDRQRCVHELFEVQVEQRHDAIAVSQKGRELTYGELNARANQLAHHLRELGVGPEVLVGICMERSLESVLACLSVLKAGGAFVPLDPAHPQERLAYMLQDAQVTVVLSTQSSIAHHQLTFENFRLICLDTGWSDIAKEKTENLRGGAGPDNLAYVIYTSGSTGRPKGVEIPHSGLLNLCAWHQDAYHVSASDRATQLAGPAFDASVWEVWPYLTAGASLHIPEETLLYPAKLLKWLASEAITICFVPTPLAEALLEETMPSHLALRVLLVGGDKLHRRPRQMLPFILANNYGPTENSVVATWTPVTGGTESDVAPPIGRPIANTQVYILDRNLRPVPVGVTGELCISGESLARGYHKRADLTAEKFIPNPISNNPGACLYKTGDRARYLPDGNIDFLGRFDNQVKLRGFRIELGEIEAVLNQHPEVQQSVVMAREDTPGDKRLIAYVVVDPGRLPTATELRDFAKTKLPDYMVPAVFITLDQLPLTPNGKIDLRALPTPDLTRPLLDRSFVPARSPVEEMLSAIWAEILGLERVSVHDNFFELGGHSLLATQVISRIRKMFEVELPLRVLFEAPTVAQMAESIENSKRRVRSTPPLIPHLLRDEIPLSFAQQRLWFLDQLQPDSGLFNVPVAMELNGDLNIEALQKTLCTVVERHEIFRTNYDSSAGHPNQIITQNKTPKLTFIDLRFLPEAHRNEEMHRCLRAEALRPFSLYDDLMLRAMLFQLDKAAHVLLITTHHIAADGWSMSILFREMAALYEAFAAGLPSPLSDLPIQYADYAIWQREWLQGEALENQLSYWREQLKGVPAVLELPADRPRPPIQSFQGARHSVILSEDLTLKLQAFSRQEGATLFMTLLAAFQALLSRYAGQQDIVVGTDVANRTHLETEGLIGFFVNLVPLRANLSGSPSFRELLRRVREVALGAYAHQELPFEKLVEELQPGRSLGHNPLIQVLFVLQNAPVQVLELPGLTLSLLDLSIETSKFDLGLFVRQAEKRLVGSWVYNTDLFDARRVMRLARNYETLLENVMAQPNIPLGNVDMVSEVEKTRTSTEKKERQVSRLKNLLSTRRKAVDLSQKPGVVTGYLDSNETLPLVIQPDRVDIQLTDWANSNREFIDKELLKHGAILFRNFNLVSATEFEQFAQALCPNLFGEYGDLPREGVGGKVYGSTPYPADQTILFHNESSHMHRWPMKIWFFCVKAAEQGGETPVVDCRRVYELMDPSFRDRFQEKKLMYVRNYTEGLDVNWQTFFRTTDRSVVEDYCRKASIDFEWRNGGLRTRQICSAVVKHPQTGEMVFFNQLQLHHISCLEPAVKESLLSVVKEEDLPRNVYYGDGSPIEDSVIQEIRGLYWKIAVSFPWQMGDILMLNNMLTAHARNPYVGSRKIVVAMGEMVSKDELDTKYSWKYGS